MTVFPYGWRLVVIDAHCRAETDYVRHVNRQWTERLSILRPVGNGSSQLASILRDVQLDRDTTWRRLEPTPSRLRNGPGTTGDALDGELHVDGDALVAGRVRSWVELLLIGARMM
jgi:hypothetical protein